ncbi:MAG: cob(I)yrinic acid a,c-diamide adenosyltransferase [Bdellovibrionaceae bacterium]|nr:cob(I)yrinic acid a,c-diamide adenosyltransferase [Pseudobdellovibrionaceae bacterium]
MTTGSPKVYTRTGDKGTTSLFGGTRVGKNDPRLEAYGTLDELNSVLGVLIATAEAHRWPTHASMEINRVCDELRNLQAQLFVMGGQLATEAENTSLRAKLPKLKSDDVTAMEQWMDRMSTDLEPLKNFVLPGGTPAAAQAHMARTIARRAERAIVALSSGQPSPDWLEEIVRHINRMNDYFFVLARHLNRMAGVTEPVWNGKT